MAMGKHLRDSACAFLASDTTNRFHVDSDILNERYLYHLLVI